MGQRNSTSGVQKKFTGVDARYVYESETCTRPMDIQKLVRDAQKVDVSEKKRRAERQDEDDSDDDSTQPKKRVR